MRNSKWHHFYHGELSDAPGRDERWDDYVCYLGRGKWKLLTEGTDFFGAEIDAAKEVMCTRDLISWVMTRDNEVDNGPLLQNERDLGSEDEDDNPQSHLGPLGARLYEIAQLEGATHCINCLERLRNGDWPPRPVLRVSAVKSVTRRGIWRGIFHPVFCVDTNLGVAYLYPPSADRRARIVLQNEGSTSPGRVVKVSVEVMKSINALMPELEALRD